MHGHLYIFLESIRKTNIEKALNRHFTKEIQIINKYMKGYSTSLGIRKI